jgi:TetR/AcrR family transcriptional regulator
MTRVLTGDVLVNEDERLQARMNQFAERIEMAFRQALRIAASQGSCEESVSARSSALCNLVLGRWLRFAKTGFQYPVADDAALQIALLLH